VAATSAETDAQAGLKSRQPLPRAAPEGAALTAFAPLRRRMREKLREAFGRLRHHSDMEVMVIGGGNEERDRLNDGATKKKRAQRWARHQLKRGNLIGLRLFLPIRKSFPLPVVVLPRRCLGIMRGRSGNFYRSASSRPVRSGNRRRPADLA
jgi:hypothetical protein